MTDRPMLERIARVIFADANPLGDPEMIDVGSGQPQWRRYLQTARKVLEVMRAPTDWMMKSGLSFHQNTRAGEGGERGYVEYAHRCMVNSAIDEGEAAFGAQAWLSKADRAAIDAALAEGEGG